MLFAPATDHRERAKKTATEKTKTNKLMGGVVICLHANEKSDFDFNFAHKV